MKLIVLLALPPLAALSALAAEEISPAPPRRSVADVLKMMPKSQLSSDGFIKVIAADVPGDEIGFCEPLLQFSTEIVNSLSKTMYMPALPRRQSAGLVIYAQDGRTNDTRVVARALRRKSGPCTYIWLPSPGFSDIVALRFQIAKAYLRAAVENYRELPAPKDAPPPEEPPDWLVEGILRQTDVEQARIDMREVLAGWSSGHLPFFRSLCSQKEVPSVLAGYLAGWMKEKRLFPEMFTLLAAGKPLDGGWLAAKLTGEDDPVKQDHISDRRLLRILRKVISPGRTSQSDLRIFASRLLLYPTFYDKMFGGFRHECTFREAALLFSGEPEVRKVAERKAREVPLYAIGRGEELHQAALAYMEFLLALARSEQRERLVELLDAADLKFEQAGEAVRKREEEGR